MGDTKILNLLTGLSHNVDIPAKRKCEIDLTFVQMYSCTLQTLHKLGTDTKTLILIFLTMKMDKENKVSINSALIADFSACIEARVYKSNFYDAISELIDNSILIKLSRGSYKVNPILFWKGTAQDRQNIIKSEEEKSPGSLNAKPYLKNKKVG